MKKSHEEKSWRKAIKKSHEEKSWRKNLIESHEEKSCRLFDQAIYLYLISCRVKSSFRVKLSSRVVESSFSTRLKFLNSTSQFDSTLFQKNFNSTRHFSSRVLNLNSSTQLDAISLVLIFKQLSNSIEKLVKILI